MGKDTHLINIYLKIHHKRPLTMDDLRYLAQYAPECFEKTCHNLVYKVPETKPIVEPPPPEPKKKPAELSLSARQNIERILDNLKRLEADDYPTGNINIEEVKTLLGNLYMEMLFPHNDKDKFFDITTGGNKSLFDRRV